MEREQGAKPKPARARVGGDSSAPAPDGPGPVRHREVPVPGRVWPAGATGGVIRRHGGLLGVADPVTVAAGAVLLHGTTVPQFDPQRTANATGAPNPPGRESAEVPDAPAWFSQNLEFSMHAAARFDTPDINVRTYRVQRELSLLAFDDVADLSAYLQSMGAGAVATNGVAEALTLQRVLAQSGQNAYDGYLLEADAVRGQREIILFGSGIAKLVPQNNFGFERKTSRWDERPGDGPGGGPKSRYYSNLTGAKFGDYDRTGGGPGTFTVS